MSLPIDIDFQPFMGLIAHDFVQFSQEFDNFKEPLQKSVRNVMRESIRENFEVGGRPPWEPLADGTLQVKAYYGYPEDILVREGRLQQVAQQLNIWEYTREEAFVKQLPQRAWYGVVHQFGLEEMYIPERPFLIIQPEDEEEIQDIFEKWIDDKLGNHGWHEGGGL